MLKNRRFLSKILYYNGTTNVTVRLPFTMTLHSLTRGQVVELVRTEWLVSSCTYFSDCYVTDIDHIIDKPLHIDKLLMIESRANQNVNEIIQQVFIKALLFQIYAVIWQSWYISADPGHANFKDILIELIQWAHIIMINTPLGRLSFVWIW